MAGYWRLSWQYVWFYRWRSGLLVACLFLTCFLPIMLGILLHFFNERVEARAQSTPLVVGARGSGLDLTLHALYFRTPPDRNLNYSEYQSIQQSELGQAIPIYSRFTAKGYPLLGTTLDYFSFRNLKLSSGNLFTTLGDCVIGAEVAREHQLQPGDQLLSDRENVLDIAGLYPLKMRVVGVIEPQRTADDRAVFVDIKTAWVIQGLGHGHQDLANETDSGKILTRDEKSVVASAAVLPYTEITSENISSFHFHGEMAEFPLTAILVQARDEKSETILLGRYQSDRSMAQALVPQVVIQELMKLIFQVKRFFDANSILIGMTTIMLMGLVISLSIRLRAGELQTMFKLGCSRQMVTQLIGAEIAIVGLLMIFCLAIAVLITVSFAPIVVERWLMN